jgi:hypothetical protein
MGNWTNKCQFCPGREDVNGGGVCFFFSFFVFSSRVVREKFCLCHMSLSLPMFSAPHSALCLSASAPAALPQSEQRVTLAGSLTLLSVKLRTSVTPASPTLYKRAGGVIAQSTLHDRPRLLCQPHSGSTGGDAVNLSHWATPSPSQPTFPTVLDHHPLLSFFKDIRTLFFGVSGFWGFVGGEG